MYLDEYSVLKTETTKLSGMKIKTQEYESDIETFKINFNDLQLRSGREVLENFATWHNRSVNRYIVL